MIIRNVREEDVDDLLAIYNEYIETPITFETRLPSREEFLSRIRNFSAIYPYYVCEDDGKIVGYSYAHRAFERNAYRWNAELTVYVDREYTKKGVGTLLYGKLIDTLTKMNVRRVFGVVRTPNPGSEALHLQFGFKVLAVFKDSGYKAGEWHDVTWFEKVLNDDKSGVPEEIVPAKELGL